MNGGIDMFNSNCASVPLVASIDGGYGGNNGFLNGDGLWGLIIILALLGWGGNGFGSFGGFGGNRGGCVEPCATQADVRAAVDQQTLISKLDQQTYGLADSTYALNSTLMSEFRGVDNAICNLGYQTQSGFNGLSAQLAQCCCDNRAAIADVKYQIATESCDTRRAIADSSRDIIENQNCNTRSILDFLVNDKLSTLQAENQELRLQASQAKQNAYLVNELRPCPVPAYITCNPYAASYGFGYNNGCGCGCA
jgi:hypothetical protein